MKRILFIIFLISASNLFSQTNCKWTQDSISTKNILRSVNFVDSLIGFAVGTYGTIFHTTNGGDNWQALNCPIMSYNSVYFTDPLTGYVAGDSAILKTIDGGNTWNYLNQAGKYKFNVVHFRNQDVGYALCKDQGWVLKTIDGGNNWKHDSLGPNMIYGMCFLDDNTGWIVGHDNRVIRTTDAGITWKYIKEKGNGDVLFCVSFVNQNTGWCGSENGKIFKTNDSGFNWDSLFCKTNTYINDIKFLDEMNGWAVGWEYSNGKSLILKTTDGGTTWDSVPNIPGRGLISIYFTNSGRGWTVGYSGTVLSYQCEYIVEVESPIETPKYESEIFPNPTNQNLNIINNSNQVITIYNIYGDKIFTDETRGNIISINTSNFPAGVYYLRIGNDRNEIIIVSH